MVALTKANAMRRLKVHGLVDSAITNVLDGVRKRCARRGHVYAYVHVYVHVYVYVYVGSGAPGEVDRVHTCMHAQLHTAVYVCMQAGRQACACGEDRLHICMHARAAAHTWATRGLHICYTTHGRPPHVCSCTRARPLPHVRACTATRACTRVAVA